MAGLRRVSDYIRCLSRGYLNEVIQERAFQLEGNANAEPSNGNLFYHLPKAGKPVYFGNE